MAVDGADIERADRLAAWAVDLKPRGARHEGSPDRRRPPHIPARRERPIPPLYDARRISPPSFIGRAGPQRGGYVISPASNGHGGSVSQPKGGPGPVVPPHRHLIR